MTDSKQSTALAPMAPQAQHPGLSVEQMQAHHLALLNLRDNLLQKGVDYGTIKGTKTPTLLKPGSEKVLKNFMVHVADIDIDDCGTPDCIRYRIRCVGQTPDGVVRGIGVGECSTDEEKYRWRKAASRAEYDATPAARRRVKYYRDGTAQQVRTQPADLANTVLKMAKKRALVDLALTACAASEFFTQDVEDLPVDLRNAIDTTAEPVPPKQPAQATPPPEPPNPKREVWDYAKPLGLTGDQVADAARAVGLVDGAEFTDALRTALFAKLDELAKDPTPEPDPDPPADEEQTQDPPVLDPFVALQQQARLMGATEGELLAAIVACELRDKPTELFTIDDGDKVIVALEDAKGA